MTSHAVFQLFSPFDNLCDEDRERILPYIKVERVPKGTFILKRGKELPAISYLLDGQVDLVDSQFKSESITTDSDRAKLPLCDQSPSPVSALAKTDVELVVVQHEAFDVLKKVEPLADFEINSEMPPSHTIPMSQLDDREDWMTSLLDAPLFSRIPPTQLQQVFQRFESQEFLSGEVVVREGVMGDYFYVIERGVVEVSTRLSGVVTQLTAGQYFGEEALVGEGCRNATVTMKSSGILMRLNKEDFKDLLEAPLLRYINATRLNQDSLRGTKFQLLDVRLPVEYRSSHVQDSINVPLAKLRKTIGELEHGITYVVTDDAGKRSEVAAHIMCQAGLDTLILQGSAEHYAPH